MLKIDLKKLEKEKLKLDSITSLQDFLKTGESFHSFFGCSVVKEEKDIFLIGKDGSVNCIKYHWRDEYHFPEIGGLIYKLNSGRILVYNGDNDSGTGFENLEVENPGENTCTLSFNCLAELLKSTRNKTFDALANGTIKLVDFTPDETRELSASDKKLFKDGKEVTPPERGFTIVHAKWHRASTVLLSYKKESWLIGQDEGTYFGVVLQDNPKTVKEAFISLIPEHIRKIKGVLRQGEWFAVPVKEKDVPKESECFCSGDNGVDLPLDTPGSNVHEISGDIRITCKGLFVRNFEMDHSQHATLVGADGVWYTFVKNTALRSVSVEGVD